MKYSTFFLAFLLLTSCKKNNDNSSGIGNNVSTIEYSLISNHNNNCSGYYWDADGKQQSVIDIRSGWAQKITARSGNTAHFTIQSNTLGDTLKAYIKLDGKLVAADSGHTSANVQYTIK